MNEDWHGGGPFRRDQIPPSTDSGPPHRCNEQSSFRIHLPRPLFLMDDLAFAVELFIAVAEHDLDTVTRVLDGHPEVIETRFGPRGDGPTALGAASCEGHVDIVRTLLDRGARVDTAWGRATPLLAACDRGHEAVVTLLIERGADPKLRSSQGANALMHAACSGNVSLVRSLLPHMPGMVNETSTVRGQTAFYSACYYGRAATAKVLLLEAGADHTVRNNEDRTPLEAAREQGHPGCVKLIQWFERELERVYVLTKARQVEDDREAISQAPTMAEVRTRTEAQKARVDAAAAYVRDRVEKGKPLPVVVMAPAAAAASGGGGATGGGRRKRGRKTCEEVEEVRREVFKHVVGVLKEDLFIDLVALLKLR